METRTVSFLAKLSYNTTFHHKIPPAQLLFNRIVKGRLPLLPTKSCPVNRHDKARINDEKSKKKSKEYADAKRKIKLVIPLSAGKTNRTNFQQNLKPILTQ